MDEDILVYVGLDVHKDTITVSVADTGRTPARYIGTLVHDVDKLIKMLAKLGQPEQLHVVYEVGPTGYGLQRALLARGYQCEVIAPSQLPRRPGDRVKTDRRDSLRLAECSRAGELHSVWIPDPQHEAMRDLSRAREDATGVFSSPKLARKLHEDVAFRVLAAGNFPAHRTLCDFRAFHLKELADLFVQVVRLAREMGLVKLGTVAVDGTKIKANASRHKAMSYERMLKAEAELKEQIPGLPSHRGRCGSNRKLAHRKGPRREGTLVEEEGSTYMADKDGDSDEAVVLRPLQAAVSIYRIAFGPRAGQKVLTLQGAVTREKDFKQTLCSDIDGFSLHAAVRCGADDRQALEQRWIGARNQPRDKRRGSPSAAVQQVQHHGAAPASTRNGLVLQRDRTFFASLTYKRHAGFRTPHGGSRGM